MNMWCRERKDGGEENEEVGYWRVVICMGIMEDVEGHEMDDKMGDTGMHGDGQEKIDK